MKLKIIKLFFIIFLTAYSATSQDRIVYITETGKKYHRYNCRSLKNRSSIEIKLSEAIAKGYDACKRCNP